MKNNISKSEATMTSVQNQKWEARGISPKTGATEWFRAAVPGNVQRDYLDYIKMTPEELMFSDNYRVFGDTEDYTWEYRCHPEFTKQDGDSVFLVFEGIDYYYEILIDGKTIRNGEGMFSAVSIDITDIITERSEIVVRILPHPMAPTNEPGTRCEAAESCKPPFCYSWDWNPRLLISGLWMPAYIETRGKNYIESCEPFYSLDIVDDKFGCANVKFETKCSGEVTYTVRDSIGNIVYRGTEPEFRLEHVRLWWCNGQGEPYLYSYTAESSDDIKSGTIGFRTIRLVKNTGTMNEPYDFPKGRYAAPITIELNGVRIFAKGSNYVNSELFVGNTADEMLTDTVKAAHDANMNIFRVWGGSGITKPSFYDACDRLGIMVWQEFMLSCNNYPDKPEYLDVLRREASSVIRTLRRHPSLVLWCGGNELFNGWSGMDDQSKPLRLLNKLCYELDENRPFLYTSPLAGMAHGGYLFRYDDGRDVFEVFPKAHNTAYSEFGVPSIASMENLRKIIPVDEIDMIAPTKSWREHHAFGAWGESRWACLDVQKYYFGECSDTETISERSRWMQAVGYKAIFEEARRQWPYCSAAINWCFNEPWICAANNSLLEYPLIKKPAYFAIENSLRPIVASARIPKFDWRDGEMFEAELWYLNDSGEAASDTITAQIEYGGKTYDMISWKTGTVPGRTNLAGPTIRMKLPPSDDEFIVLRLIASDNSSNEYRLLHRCSSYKTGPRILNM